MLNPLLSLSLRLDLNRAKDLVCKIRLQRSCKVAFVVAPDPEGSSVLVGLDIHAPVAFILEPNLAGSAAANRDLHGGRQGLGQRLSVIVDSQASTIDWEVVCRRDRESPTVLEGTVLDQLGVDATVTGIVDVLLSSMTANARRFDCHYLMKEAVSVGVAKLASLVTSSGLDGDVYSTDRCYCSSCKERLCKETHVDDCEDRCSQSEDQTTRPGPWLL